MTRVEKVTHGAQSLANIPSDLVQHAGMGTEQIGSDDVRPPRLKICQSGTPQRKPDNEKQIAGLQELDLFNDLSTEIYGRGPLPIVIIMSLGSKHMVFAPDGKSVLEFDVPASDPRTRFTNGPDGKRVKPIASKFYNYLVWLPESQEVVALSLSGTLITTAIKLNGLLTLPLKIDQSVLMNPPAWARTYTIETRMKEDKGFAWGVLNLKQVGVTPEDTRQQCAQLAGIYSKKKIDIDYDASEAAEGGAPAGAVDGEVQEASDM